MVWPSGWVLTPSLGALRGLCELRIEVPGEHELLAKERPRARVRARVPIALAQSGTAARNV
jgi:hypothetical protein